MDPISRRTLLLTGTALTAAAMTPGIAWAGGNGHRLAGPSIQIDPTFPYYLDRSADSIAEEIWANGYRIAHYFVTNELSVNGDLIEALHRRGIAVWALVVGNGSYAVDGWPDGWQDWQMQLLKPVDFGGFHMFSPFSAAYVDFKKGLLARLVAAHPFDGVEIAEPYFPDWNGLTTGTYGDVGPFAQAAFRRAYGLDIPDFTDPSAPTYYKTDTARYAKWVQLRVDAVNGYLDEIVNGARGVRATRPDILVGTWSLGIDGGPDSVALEREYQGLDAGRMVAKVRPDVHFLQTNYPDWLKPDLPPDYVRTYQPFVDQIRAARPQVPIGVQTDIGSQLPMARDDAWLREFAATVKAMGLATWTAYEYHIGGYMYVDPPVPTSARLATRGSIEVIFSKRIDPGSAKRPGSFALLPGGSVVAPDAVTVDGNRVTLATGRPPAGDLRVAVKNVTDAPDRWLYNKTGPANAVRPGTTVRVSRA